MVSLSVVIPATDRRSTLSSAIEAVRNAVEPAEELIVVEEPAGLGPAAARNVGAARAVGEIVVFVDADVLVHRDALRRIRRAFESDGDLAAVFGSYDDDPGSRGVVSDFRNLLHHHVHHRGAGRAATFWAGLGAIRRDVFLDAGGFDERRFPHPSIEDIELGMRVVASGGLIVLDPTIQGKHLKRWTLSEMIRTDFARRGVPWLRLMLETRSSSTALNLGWENRLATAASLLLVAAIVRRDLRLATAALAVVVGLDRSFYHLILRRRGPAASAVGIPLHVLHRLTSAAAVPFALARHVSSDRHPLSRPPD